MSVPSFRLTLCILVSIALHGLIGLLWRAPDTPQTPALDNDHFAISVGMQAAIAGAVAQAPQTPQATPSNTAQPVSPQETSAQPVTQAAPNQRDLVPTEDKTPPEAQPVTEKPAHNAPHQASELDKPAKTTTKPQPKKKTEAKQSVEKTSHTAAKKVVKPASKTPPAKAAPKPHSQPAQQAQASGHAGKDGSSQDKPRVQETGTGQQAASASHSDRFDFAVRRHLLKHKKPPHILNPHRKHGTVTLQFVLDRQGHVLEYTVKKSAHVREFDKAAIRLLKKAEPFPRPPSDVHWQQRRYRMDIDYRVQ